MLVPLNVAIKYLCYCIFKSANNNDKQKFSNLLKKKLVKSQLIKGIFYSLKIV